MLVKKVAVALPRDARDIRKRKKIRCYTQSETEILKYTQHQALVDGSATNRGILMGRFRPLELASPTLGPISIGLVSRPTRGE